MSDLVADPRLRSYLNNVRNWHGYIRFLGLPDRRDNPDVLIDRLFVEPLLSRRYVSPDEDTNVWIGEAETIFDTLKTGSRVILLGDPGTGKSTLLNFLVWLLARPTGEIWTERLGEWLLPVPMVLRELHLRNVMNFSGLLDAFLDHAMSEPLRGSVYLEKILDEGKALVLLDGIDELGDPVARNNLRDAVYDGFDLYPNCRWLLSSRIVGYDEVPFNTQQTPQTISANEPSAKSAKSVVSTKSEKIFEEQDLSSLADLMSKLDNAPVITRYIAPFDDRRIEEFARNWYIQREAVATRAGENTTHLIKAVHANNAILRLARIPNLLTLMALIHRVEATLPHGRALLYERIAEAYLESIDKYRGVYSGAYNLTQKRRWLARVGYEMQCRRSTSEMPKLSQEEAELLAASEDVYHWLEEEMKRAGGDPSEMSARDFLDVVGRRSGLFLPRSENRYAFVHLSFQDYFAAVALEREVTGVKWAKNQQTSLGLDRNLLSRRAAQSVWCETFAFLFELLSPKEDWHDELLEVVFGPHFSLLDADEDSDASMNRTRLLVLLVINRRSRLAQSKRFPAISAAVRTSIKHWVPMAYPPSPPSVFRDLLGDDLEMNAACLREICAESSRRHSEELSLVQTRVSNLKPLATLTTLKKLYLKQTQITDVGPLSNLTALELLDLAYTQIADVRPLSNLAALEWLDLEHTQIAEIGPLSNLALLKLLDLSNTQVTELGPLAGLAKLEWLHLGQTQSMDLAPLRNCSSLEFLNLAQTRILDIAPLANVTSLNSLLLWGTEIADLDPLSNLKGLQRLDCDFTRVSDLNPLSNLTSLRILEMTRTKVTDLRPLANLSKLEVLDVEQTEVADVEPLANLKSLKVLRLRSTCLSEASVNELRKCLVNCEILYDP